MGPSPRGSPWPPLTFSYFEDFTIIYRDGSQREQTDPFDWEDHLYETWLEEKRERRRTGEIGVQGGDLNWNKRHCCPR